MFLMGDTIDTHVDEYYRAGKAAESLRSGLLGNDEFLAPMASFLQSKTMEAIGDQITVEMRRLTPLVPLSRRRNSL